MKASRASRSRSDIVAAAILLLTAMRHLFPVFLLCTLGLAQAPKFRAYNYDESKVGSYTLPDPLVLENGRPVTTAKVWNDQRRPELLRLFESQMFGKRPQGPYHVQYSAAVVDRSALGGKAIRKQLTMSLADHADGPQIHLLIYLPAGAAQKPCSVFLGLNFSGNHTVMDDPEIELHDVWVRGKRQPADPATRGSQKQQWQVEKLLSAGYGLATIYYGDIEPDFDGGMKDSVRAIFPGTWGAIDAWAWGLSRALDYLATDRDVNARQVAVMGHSRLGKTAVWAGASDTRFAMVISNDSGEGGAALSKRDYGETIEHLNVAFPHWFCENYKQYSGHPEKLPFDSNELLSLVAPRPLYVASAEDDKGSDPRGEFLGAAAAGRVYELLGKRGLGTEVMPALHQPIQYDVAYHIRAGKHDVTEYDWEQYIRFANQHFRL